MYTYISVVTVVVVFNRGGVVRYGSGVSSVVVWRYVGLVMTYDALGGHGVTVSIETGVGSGQESAESYDLKTRK